jgi:Cytochrome c
MKNTRALSAGLAVGAAVVALVAGGAQADKDNHSSPRGTPAQQHPKAPVRITMEELHKHGGVPPGWRLTVPSGDPTAGRDVFAKLECYKCHVIKGEQFPHATKSPKDAGPDLTGMGRHHPAEYFFESILNPNSVIVTGPGHTGPDGLSIMPDYRESLTVSDLINLVAYMGSLGGEHGHPPADRSESSSPEHPHGGRPKRP